MSEASSVALRNLSAFEGMEREEEVNQKKKPASQKISVIIARVKCLHCEGWCGPFPLDGRLRACGLCGQLLFTGPGLARSEA